jgi:ABC-type sugar transport system ATPase subunit
MSDRIAVMRGGTIVTVLPGRSDAQAVMEAALDQRANANLRPNADQPGASP